MGKVIDLHPRDSARRVRRRPSKTALVLGGGGFTGGVYQIGALRALDLLAANRSVNDFDVYVGTSAGAFVAALAANGVTPAEMMRVVDGREPTPFRRVGGGTLLRPNWLGLARRGVTLPLTALRALHSVAGRLGQVSAMDVVLALADGLPSGLYSGSGIEGYLREVLGEEGRSDDFRAMRRTLFVCATDLDTCERIVFGAPGWDDVPVSRAVRASTAMPMVYEPVRIRDRELVDGGIVSTTNIDLAVEAGARFIVVVNPLVPYVNDFGKSVTTLGGRRPRHVSDMGFPKIGYQAFRLLAYQRLHEMATHWRERYPGVDIVLIEPEPDDELMFETSIMDFASRVRIARHGFESVTRRLAGDYDTWHEICARHGIRISAARVREAAE